MPACSVKCHPVLTPRLLVLAAVAPPSLQAEVVMLVPRLVAPAEHTQAAGALLGRLAEASRQGPGCEASLRLPVLAALGRLRIDPAVADRVLHAALAVRATCFPSLQRSLPRSAHLCPRTGEAHSMRWGAHARDRLMSYAIVAMRAKAALLAEHRDYRSL